MGLVVRIAKGFHPKDHSEMEDYVQEGRIALWKAIKKYDANRGALSTLAWEYITKAILRYKTKEKKHHSTQELYQEEKVFIQPHEIWQFIPEGLEPRELVILDMRSKGYTFQEIGTTLGFTRGWINRIYKTVINKMVTANE